MDEQHLCSIGPIAPVQHWRGQTSRSVEERKGGTNGMDEQHLFSIGPIPPVQHCHHFKARKETDKPLNRRASALRWWDGIRMDVAFPPLLTERHGHPSIDTPLVTRKSLSSKISVANPSPTYTHTHTHAHTHSPLKCVQRLTLRRT